VQRKKKKGREERFEFVRLAFQIKEQKEKMFIKYIFIQTM